MIYYRRYIQDYIAATHRLTILEHGAYNLLLDYYYADEKPLPADKDELYLLVRAMTAQDRKAVDKVLERYFTLREDGYHNDRADHEIEVSKTARCNGKAGGRPPKNETDDGTGSETGSITGQQTGIETTDGTEAGTADVTGSGHPFSLSTKTSLSTTQPLNRSTKPVTPAAPPSRKPRREPSQATAEVWQAYSAAYLDRYHTEPVRNAKVNTHIARFVDRVGAAEAPQIAAFYLTHSRHSYVASKHDSKFLDLDAEGLRTEWATGNKVTQTQAMQADRTQAIGGAFQKLIAETRANR